MYNSHLKCRTCKRYLNQASVPDTRDCGGDCLRCLASCYDPGAMAEMRKLEPNNSMWIDNPEDDAERASEATPAPLLQIRLAQVLPELAAAINDVLVELAGKPVPFVLLTSFDTTTQYISNTKRDVGIKLIESLRRRWVSETEAGLPPLNEAAMSADPATLASIDMPTFVAFLGDLAGRIERGEVIYDGGGFAATVRTNEKMRVYCDMQFTQKEGAAMNGTKH